MTNPATSTSTVSPGCEGTATFSSTRCRCRRTTRRTCASSAGPRRSSSPIPITCGRPRARGEVRREDPGSGQGADELPRPLRRMARSGRRRRSGPGRPHAVGVEDTRRDRADPGGHDPHHRRPHPCARGRPAVPAARREARRLRAGESVGAAARRPARHRRGTGGRRLAGIPSRGGSATRAGRHVRRRLTRSPAKRFRLRFRIEPRLAAARVHPASAAHPRPRTCGQPGRRESERETRELLGTGHDVQVLHRGA